MAATSIKDLLGQVAVLEATAAQATAKIGAQAQQIKGLQATVANLQALLQAANANAPSQDTIDQASSDATTSNTALAGAVGDPLSVVTVPQASVDKTTADLTAANKALVSATTP